MPNYLEICQQVEFDSFLQNKTAFTIHFSQKQIAARNANSPIFLVLCLFEIQFRKFFGPLHVFVRVNRPYWPVFFFAFPRNPYNKFVPLGTQEKTLLREIHNSWTRCFLQNVFRNFLKHSVLLADDKATSIFSCSCELQVKFILCLNDIVDIACCYSLVQINSYKVPVVWQIPQREETPVMAHYCSLLILCN